MGDGERITVTFYEEHLEDIRQMQAEADCSQAEAVRRLVMQGDKAAAMHSEAEVMRLLRIAAFGRDVDEQVAPEASPARGERGDTG